MSHFANLTSSVTICSAKLSGDERILSRKARPFQYEGRLDQAANALRQIHAHSNDDNVVSARAWQLLRERRFATDLSSEVKFEMGHGLFLDIIGYSKLLINEHSEQLQKLKEIRGTEQVRAAGLPIGAVSW